MRLQLLPSTSPSVKRSQFPSWLWLNLDVDEDARYKSTALIARETWCGSNHITADIPVYVYAA